MDEISRTIIPENNGGWGGTALGAGVGGLLGSWLGNGGFGGGWNRGASVGIGYDTGALNGIQGQLNNISGQIANADRDLLMQTANSNQFVGNLVNSTGDAITGAINSTAMGTQAGIFQNTLSQTQNSGATNLAMCQGFNSLNQNISQQGFNNQLAIVEQNGANRLQAQELASQQKDCCCQVLRAIEQEGCANRELQREIQTQAIRDKLTETQNALSASIAQGNLINALGAQTATLLNAINSLKPATTA